MVLLLRLEAAELEELRADEVVEAADADAVGPKVLVALPVGNMAEVLEREESVELPRLAVLFPEANGIELEELMTEEVTELEVDDPEELTSLDDEATALDETDAPPVIEAVVDDEDTPIEEDVVLAEADTSDDEAEEEVMVAVALY